MMRAPSISGLAPVSNLIHNPSRTAQHKRRQKTTSPIALGPSCGDTTNGVQPVGLPILLDSSSRVSNPSNHFAPVFTQLLARLVQIATFLRRYCEMRARSDLTSVACLRMRREVSEARADADEKCQLLQSLVAQEIREYSADDEQLKERLQLLKDARKLLSGITSIVECASSISCADFATNVEMLGRRFRQAFPMEDNTTAFDSRTSIDPNPSSWLLDEYAPAWGARDKEFDRQLHNLANGVDNLDSLALSIRDKNTELRLIISENDQDATLVVQELTTLQERMRFVQKLLKRSRFWCYISLMIIIVLLSASLGLLIKTSFDGSSVEIISTETSPVLDDVSGSAAS